MGGDGTVQQRDEAVSSAGRERWCSEQTFFAELAQVRAGRAWLREVFPSGCLLRDDCVTVLSELLANCAEHGGGGRARVVVTHAWGRVTGMLVHHATPTAQIRVPEAKACEGGDVESLEESGRGLAVVAAICGGEVEIDQQTDRTVTRWRLHGSCLCEETDEE